MKQTFTFFLFTTITLLGCSIVNLSFWSTTSTENELQPLTYDEIFHGPGPSVFFLPHQDDEMHMAGAIKANIEMGRTVYVVMVTDGGASAVRYALNHENYTLKKQIISLSGAENDYVGKYFDRQTFSAARNREFMDSIVKLGVPADNVFFANPGGVNGSNHPEFLDGQLTKTAAKAVIDFYLKKFGDGSYATVAATGMINFHQSDHKALREALAEEPDIFQKYFFSEKLGVGTKVPLTALQLEAKSLALHSYFDWDPGAGRFAIAALSVKPMLLKREVGVGEYYLTKSELTID